MRFLNLFIAFLLLVSMPNMVLAQSSSVSHDEATVTLIAGNVEGGTLHAGLRTDIKEHWKTYWRTPGDGGLAATFDWTGSENIGDVTIRWPAPKRYSTLGVVENYGYKDEVVYPLDIKINDPSKPIKLNAKVNYAICDEQCVFFSDQLTLDIAVGYENAESLALIQEYANRVPKENGTDGLEISNWSLTDEDEGKGQIMVEVLSKEPFANLGEKDLFIEADPNFKFSSPSRIDYSKVLTSDGRMVAKFFIDYEILVPDLSLQEKPVIITFVSAYKAVEKSGTVEKKSQSSENIALILLFAFIGGFILNFMPCVLPVLSLKVLGVMKHGGGHENRVRLSFLASAAGIITSFLVLAGFIYFLQSAGMNIGWGFHFQQPLFIITMVLIMVIFSANMWGFFEIRMPQFVNRLVPKEDDHTLLGHFLLGALATLLATPCSAPFLGTAIGFAFTQGAYEMFLTFGVMGAGLAAPYLLIVARPQMVSRLPKPGMWMLKFKHVLGWFLAATALWLLWVAWGLLGSNAAITLLCLSLLIISVLAFVRNKPQLLRQALLLVVAICALSYYLPMHIASSQKAEITSTDVWQKFDQSKIPALVASGKTVFVDITADWCLTCKANKILVLNTPEIISALSQSHVVAMEGDWTKPDPVISDYLSSFNRHGIPFNVVYGPGAPEGIVLSELLTKDAVLTALNKASGN